ncbi:hypothetical protein [Chryseobacterium phocaeense]|uniref:hypothetical protein n=1 Tax=Chryseobacterium phocaeense TaxID=1816690 RepID=UPI0009BA4B24|nr:hypothetical protein [Chryseobacterium phocaeense]
MKILNSLLFCLVFICSCSKQNGENRAGKPKPVLIKIGYHPTFHNSAETIVNFNEKYIIFYSPVAYSIAPPPPPGEEGQKMSIEYKEYLSERPKLEPFRIELTENDLEKIRQISDSFTSEDFSDKNVKPAIDGMSTNIIIVYSDGKLIQINPMNAPNEKQKALYGGILDLLIEKNTNKNDSTILQKIKGYH